MSEEVKNGVFLSNLTKNFRQIKEDRAQSVTEDVETEYRRHIEDLCKAIRDKDRALNNLMLNMAPTTAFENSVVPADFNANAFMMKEQEIMLQKKTLEETTVLMLGRYEYYFGKFPEVDLVHKVLPNWNSSNNAETE